MNEEASNKKHTQYFMFVIAGFWSIIGAAYIFLVTFYDIPRDNIPTSNTILGFLLGTIVATVINFYFGSSNGSHEKNELMKKPDQE